MEEKPKTISQGGKTNFGSAYASFSESPPATEYDPDAVKFYAAQIAAQAKINEMIGASLGLSGSMAGNSRFSSGDVNPRIGANFGGILDVGAGQQYRGIRSGNYKESMSGPKYDANVLFGLLGGRGSLGYEKSALDGERYSGGYAAPVAGGNLSANAGYAPSNKDLSAFLNWSRNF